MNMFVIINALKSITRSKGRNILIGIIVLAIAASSCVALAIRNAAEEAQISGAESLRITGSISLDRQKLMESAGGGGRGDRNAMREIMSQFQELDLSELLNYADSDYVKDFYYSSSVSLNASGDLEAVGADEVEEPDFIVPGGPDEGGRGRASGSGQGMQSRGGMAIGRIAMGDFSLIGYSSENAMSKFISGTAQITDGEMFDFEAANQCLISNELAVYNGLSAGDEITLTNPNVEADEALAPEEYTFTIVGIYTDTGSTDTGGMPMFSTALDPANLICVSYSTLQEIIEYSESVAVIEENEWGMEMSTALRGQLSSAYVFTSPKDYDSFNSELTEKGLSENYVLSSTDYNNYESGLIPLKNLSEFATTLLMIVLAIGAVILIVINVFNIRERKYEVGVLTAIGIKKGKVAMQFVTELLCVTFVAIIIGAGIGAVASVPVSNNLLSAQIEQAQSEAESQEQNFGRGAPAGNFSAPGRGGGGIMIGRPMMSMFGESPAEVTYLDKINATVNFSVMWQLIGIGIILTIISSLAAVVFVMRYEPLKILAERA